MNLKLSEKYKYLIPFELKGLPDFIVLTGINGSGKTQLLTGINAGKIEVNYNSNIIPQNSISWSIGRLDTQTVAYEDQVYPEINTIWKALEEHIIKSRVGEAGEAKTAFSPINIGGNIRARSIFEQIYKKYDGDISKITYDELKLNYPIFPKETDGSLTLNVPYIYKRYRDKWIINNYFGYLKEKGIQVPHLSDEEFIARYGPPPWEILNRMLEEANIGYRTNQPEYIEHRNSFSFVLTSKSDPDVKIGFNDMSSGEIVITTLGLALYGKEEREFPNLLLMDEPDRNLHPSMCKQMMDVLRNVFVKELGIKIILTTHSPSTVAIAPEESIFLMDKMPQKITKDEALKRLTSGIPTLSIDYKNHRQVFVESPSDAKYYQSVYDKLCQNNKYQHRLYFIPSGGFGKGNSVTVKELVLAFQKSGNENVFGIIDWDLVSESQPANIEVHGKDSRYTLENYLLDPILFFLYLLSSNKNIDNIYAGCKIDNTYNPIDLINGKSNERAQEFSDWVLNKVFGQIIGDKIIIKYACGIKLSIPREFMHMQGHELMGKFKSAFQSIQKKTNEELEKELITNVVKNYHFINPDTKQLIDKLSVLI